MIGSSDNHLARPGTGYKEFARGSMAEATVGDPSKLFASIMPPPAAPLPKSRPVGRHGMGGGAGEMERNASFLYTGGLAAVHSSGRHRSAIWDGLQKKEVYATSGPRILLWFDLLNGPDGNTLPMGSDLVASEAPKFRVRAAGAFKQKPGCPEYSVNSLTPERLEFLCKGECYNPSDERHLITRIEIVRIRPQAKAEEPVADLIEAPWRTFDCAPDPEGCTVEFDDPEYAELGRDTVYYARAIQEATPAVNGENLGCEGDSDVQCKRVRLCVAEDPEGPAGDCLAPIEERAWSSPIFMDYGK